MSDQLTLWVQAGPSGPLSTSAERYDRENDKFRSGPGMLRSAADGDDGAAAIDQRGRARLAAAGEPARSAVIDLRAPGSAEGADLGAATGLAEAGVRLGDVHPAAGGGGLGELEGVGAIALGRGVAAVVARDRAHRGVARGERSGPGDESWIAGVPILRQAGDTDVAEIEP